MDVLMGLFWLLAALIGVGVGDPACLLLGGLDATRTQAFVSDDERRLRDVYANDQAARADVETLRSYRKRGLRLEGMLLVRESCRVAGRSAESITLEIVDRLGPTRVRAKDGSRRELPRDRPTRRTVVLDLTDHGWRVAAVGSGEAGLER
jgi:hypothetical protein